MATLRTRLERLEAQPGNGADAGPSVIFICAAPDGEALAAMVLRGPGGVGHLERAEGETDAAFIARASIE